VSSLSAPTWRSVPRGAIVLREWDGEVVVRNECTGSSHLLGPLAGRVLHALLGTETGLSVADIVGRLHRDAAAADTPDPSAAVVEVLQEFRRLGLAGPDAS